jgi:hypothetical protein
MDETALKEAFVNARIRNSLPATANCAIEHSKSDDDELAIYVGKTEAEHCHGKPSEQRRLGEMRRPGVLFDALH